MAAALFALPGMGADERMFPSPWNELTGLVAVTWRDASHCRTLGDLARTLVDTHRIKDGDVVIGTSLGGIVACEIARLRSLSKLILIGSAMSRSEVNPLLTSLNRLADYAPIPWIKALAASFPMDLCRMFRETDAEFMRAMCREIAHWSGYIPGRENAVRLHGRHDWVIPMPTKIDHVIDGGHLITMTNAKECVGIVRLVLEGSVPPLPRSTH